MGQEQSYVAHGGVAQVRRHREDYEEPAHRRSDSADRDRERERDGDLRRHRARRSADSFKSDNSNESGGYRSGSSGYRSGSSGYRSGSSGFRSDGSARSEHYCPPLYKNDHYRDVTTSKELYKPVKIAKDRRHKLQLFDGGEDKGRLGGYLCEEGKAKPINAVTTPKRAGIRNYTPKILSEGEQKRIESWI